MKIVKWLLRLTFLGAFALPAAEFRPNLVLIIADDMSWEDCGAYGNAGIRTPNLNRLAGEGMKFTAGFVTTSSCSPSRASMITGRYPHNTGAQQLHMPLPKTQRTFVELLRAGGYWTAAVGKWHLGGQVKDRFDLVREPTGKSGCEQWVATMRDRPKAKPFFLWLAALDPHRDYHANTIPKPHAAEEVRVPPYLPDAPETRKDLAQYYDEISRLDGYVGQVLGELDRQQVASNTVVVFISDNGRPFPRCKTTLYDSGIRSPWIVRWPAKVKAGAVCDRLVSTVDLAPTFLRLAQVTVPEALEGRDFSSLFENPKKIIREYINAEHHWHDFDACERAVRSERYKYIRNDFTELAGTPPADAVRSPTFQLMRGLRDAKRLNVGELNPFTRPRPAEELYDLESDPDEMKNLAQDAGHAETLKTMRAELARWQKETGDKTPVARTPDTFDRETGQPLSRKR